MRLLANENFPRLAVQALRARGHDVFWVRTDAPGISDREVMERAAADHRLLITFGKDFGELAFRAFAPEYLHAPCPFAAPKQGGRPPPLAEAVMRLRPSQRRGLTYPIVSARFGMKDARQKGDDPMDPQRDEVERNYQAFEKMLPSLLQTHRGKFALMRDGEIVEFFDTINDAFLAGRKLYGDIPFSIQEVIADKVDLGFFSHALPH